MTDVSRAVENTQQAVAKITGKTTPTAAEIEITVSLP